MSTKLGCKYTCMIEFYFQDSIPWSPLINPFEFEYMPLSLTPKFLHSQIYVPLSSCFMHRTKVNLSKTLPLQLICNQGSHPAVKTSNHLLQCSTPSRLVYVMETHKSIHDYFKEKGQGFFI